MKLIESIKTYSNLDFINKAKLIHNDENGEPLFDYSKTKYVGSKYPITIICKKCGNEFSQRASHHINGSGCKKCANEKLSKLRLSNTEAFINKSKAIHGNKYNYDNVNYINNITKVLLHCNLCQKEFLQTPQSHINGNGCPICAKKLHSQFMMYSLDDFIKKAKSKHIDYTDNIKESFQDILDFIKNNYINEI